VADIEREIAPDIPLRRWDSTACCQSQREKSLYAGAAQPQRSRELSRRHTMVIDATGSSDAVFAPERLHPAAPGVMDVSGDRADRAARHCRDREIPERRRQLLDEVDGDAIVRPPRTNETGLQFA